MLVVGLREIMSAESGLGRVPNIASSSTQKLNLMASQLVNITVSEDPVLVFSSASFGTRVPPRNGPLQPSRGMVINHMIVDQSPGSACTLYPAAKSQRSIGDNYSSACRHGLHY